MTQSSLTQLNKLFPQTKAGLSFRVPLQGVFERCKPKRILEWGPGHSTVIMAELAPDAQIVSVEHDPAWFYKAKQVLGELPNVDMRLRELSLRPRNYGYVTWPLAYSLETGTKFDFVFIDGRCRLDCMRIAALCLDEGGCVMVHDYYGRANRYEFGSRFFHTVEHYEKHDTIVYCKPKFGLHKVGL